ncbi:MAG: SpoIIE family protein phosphatase, partial [Candidatus Riflebacteria bacterium]|nr:SpoIIE family protein phosphatase [Candidatus Riflebacteria bacterium]
IEIDSKDELGLLGQAFNQMMADIKDLLLAGAVQQCLIPNGKYKLEGYDCLVYNQMASKLGGDYADIFELTEDKVLIVIGDVTGHGISSSLLTAMVKASIFIFSNKKDVPLNQMVSNISMMISDLLNKKKLMTFCAVILDKNTGEIAVCNAGHPFPIIREKQIGKSRTTELSGFPMGASKRRCKYTSETETINPGETLILYTDGFPEAENEKGEDFGYKRFNQLITDSIINSAEELRK